jgi:hypothetical protein
MPDVVEKRRQTHETFISLESGIVVPEDGPEPIPESTDDRLKQHRRDVHDAEGVLEAGMHGAGVDLVGPGELADAAETLERGVIDDLTLPVVERDEPVNGATDLVRAMRVRHGRSLREESRRNRRDDTERTATAQGTFGYRPSSWLLFTEERGGSIALSFSGDCAAFAGHASRHGLAANTSEQNVGRFVVRVLRDEAALKGTLEDALAEAGGAVEVGLDLSLDLFHDGESSINLLNDLGLLISRRKNDGQCRENFQINVLLCRCGSQPFEVRLDGPHVKFHVSYTYL